VNFLIWAAAVLIILICLAALYLHKQLITHRIRIDEATNRIEELQETRLDHLDAGDTEAAAKIESELDKLFEQNDKNITAYNEYISRFPGRIIALAVGLSKEEI